jgi:CheY-like chemotaxis protein/HPt (histidine-containing phosphotransfer) domain-containing protein
MLTSSGTGQAAAVDAGVSEFLTKPVRQSRLYDAIASAMHQAPLARRETETEAEAEAERPGPGHDRPRPAADRARILIAEDHDVNRILLERLLARRGHETVVATNGVEAVRMACEAGVDLVFMDCQMPELDGYEATRRIREREGRDGDVARRVPIVAMTAHAMAGDRERCLEAGMDDYLAKPLRPDEMDAVLERWLTAAPDEGDADGPAGDRGEADRNGNGNGEPVAALDDERFGDLHRDFPPEVVREVVHAFIDSTPPIVERIVLAAEGEDHLEITQGAHRLKGSCLAVGAGMLNDVAVELEALGREGAGGHHLRDAAERLENAWRVTRTALRTRVDGV